MADRPIHSAVDPAEIRDMVVILGCLVPVAALAALVAWLGVRLRAARGDLVVAEARLDRVARTDSLTGLFNRHYANEQLRLTCASARRHGFPVAVLMVDIDHLERLNVLFGQSAGDDAIRYVADRMASSLRTEDLAARWASEEFVLVLPHTDLEEALGVAERLRAEIGGRPAILGADGDLVALSVSIGVAERPGDLAEALTHHARLALATAKQSGGNRVCPSESAVSSA